MARDIFGRDQRGRRNDEPELRVTDRRRIQLDDSDNAQKSAFVESPNLKPSYVEELETRTKAAEQKMQEVQSRFEQLRKQLQTETDETRQRLNRAADERAQREKANFIVRCCQCSTTFNARLPPPTPQALRKSLPKAYGERLRVSRTHSLPRVLSQSMRLVKHLIRSCTKPSRQWKWRPKMRVRLLISTRAVTK